ncbi:RNA polymerase sigma factor [Pedobacter metabolipauper]|nr:sigma-70 family RNA polymerase sigma factor [Pedobacter metabolipauper]
MFNNNPDSNTEVNIPRPDESDLINGLKNGEELAYSKLYKMYAATLLGIICRIVKTEEIAEDVLQETFIKIGRSIGQYEPAKGRLFTWMARLARNSAIDHLRSRGNLNSNKNNDLDMVSNEVDSSYNTTYNPDTIGIKKLTYTLNDSQKQVLDLIYFEGYTHTEVAERLQIPIGTVKTRIRMAIQNLRKFF